MFVYMDNFWDSCWINDWFWLGLQGSIASYNPATSCTIGYKVIVNIVQNSVRSRLQIHTCYYHYLAISSKMMWCMYAVIVTAVQEQPHPLYGLSQLCTNCMPLINLKMKIIPKTPLQYTMVQWKNQQSPLRNQWTRGKSLPDYQRIGWVWSDS